jgi:hypothetical protein
MQELRQWFKYCLGDKFKEYEIGKACLANGAEVKYRELVCL